jgi:hypothetical protein
MEPDYYAGPLRLLANLAALMGLSCLGGASAFFIRNPQPFAVSFVAWVLVATCTLFVVIVAAVFAYCFRSWRRAMKMESEYWWMRKEIHGG